MPILYRGILVLSDYIALVQMNIRQAGFLHCKVTLRDCERGAGLVENVIILPLMLGILIVAFDMLLMSVNVLNIRYASARVMREVAIGGHSSEEIRQLVQRFAKSLGTNLPPDYITMCPLASYATPTCESGKILLGNNQQLMVLELRLPLRGIVLGTISKVGFAQRFFDFRARTVGRLEP